MLGVVLVPYRVADFQGGQKPKGEPLEIGNFFVEGDRRKGLEGVRVRSLLKSKTLLIRVDFGACPHKGNS